MKALHFNTVKDDFMHHVLSSVAPTSSMNDWQTNELVAIVIVVGTKPVHVIVKKWIIIPLKMLIVIQMAPNLYQKVEKIDDDYT